MAPHAAGDGAGAVAVEVIVASVCAVVASTQSTMRL
jgi:hypothetical protein